MKFVLSNWNNEEYEFSPEILLDYDASKATTNESFPTVDYNTNVKELCQGHIAANWKGYMEHNSSGYFFAVVGEDGRCEHGVGRTKEDAFNECTKWQEENNIVGTCELYGKDGEVVWDGSVWDD
jgi:hypothetical protein